MKNSHDLKTILNRLNDAPKYADDMRSSRMLVYSDCYDMTQYSKVIPTHEKLWLLEKIMQQMIKTDDHKSAMFEVIERNSKNESIWL